MSKAKSKPSQDCVVVLGMHRSGTSALAGMLSMLGCATPASLIKGDANNEKGYFESNAVGRLSDKILQALDTQWSDWLPLDIGALTTRKRTEFTKMIAEVIATDFGAAPLFVLKEPRMCRMVPLWHDAIRQDGTQVHFVHTHRNPQEVAASLAKRDGFEPAYGYLLWLRHVLDAENATRGAPRMFTSYAQLMQNWRDVADRLAADLALPSSLDRDAAATDIDTFLSQRLHHNTDTAEQTLANHDLPQMLRDTFAVMERWAANGEDPKDHPRLDTLRAELDALATQFAPLARPGQMALLESQRRAKEVSDHEQQNTTLAADLKAAKADTATLRVALKGKRTHVETLTNALAKRDSEVQTRRVEVENLRAQIIKTDKETQKLHADVSTRDRSIEAMSGDIKHLRAASDRKDLEMARFLDVIRERGEAIKERDNDLAGARSDLQGRTTEAQTLHNDAITREETIQKLQDENTLLAQSVAEAEHRNRLLTQSPSWRFTAPLRSFLIFLRGRAS